MSAANRPNDPWATGASFAGIASRWCDAESRMQKVRESGDAEWLRRVVRCKDTQKTVREAAERRIRRLLKTTKGAR